MLESLLRKLSSLAEIALIVAAGLGCSQLSAFMQHYVQTLSGRLAEARLEVAGIIDRAGQAGLPVYAYVNEFVTAENPVYVREGRALQARIDRAGRLIDSHAALRNAGMVTRPVVFLTHLDSAIAGDVWRHFEPRIPVDGASLLYSGVGMLLALILYQLGKIVVILIARRVRRRGAEVPSARPG